MSGAGHNRLAALAADIRIAAAASQRAAREALASAIQAGAKLIEAKGLLSHGEWLPWLRDHAGISERSARDYMRLARSGLDIGSAADLSIRAALAIVTESDDANMPLPLLGELMELHRPWIGWQRECVHAGIWRSAEDPQRFHLVLMVQDGEGVSFAAYLGTAALVRAALEAFGLDRQTDHDGYWSLLIAADASITKDDGPEVHVSKVRAVAERLAPTFDIENSPTIRYVIRPDASGWEAAEALREFAEQLTDRELARHSGGAA